MTLYSHRIHVYVHVLDVHVLGKHVKIPIAGSNIIVMIIAALVTNGTFSGRLTVCVSHSSIWVVCSLDLGLGNCSLDPGLEVVVTRQMLHSQSTHLHV